MILKRIKSEKIAHISYFVGSNPDSIIIDPRRDCDIYVEIAKRENLKIKYIFETHRNEDYVTGSLELADKTGAEIYHGSALGFEYGNSIYDSQEFIFGSLNITAIETPGHTYESISFLLKQISSPNPICLFSGDTLFFGDVGRIDLYGPGESSKMAHKLYHSLFQRILKIGDNVIFYPSHGAGSMCGGSISTREQSTIGEEKIHNPMLQKSEKDFVESKINERIERPPYFLKMERYNLKGPPLLKNIIKPVAFSPNDFQKEVYRGAIIIDTRSPKAFAEAHIEGSFNIWLEGLPTYSGWVLPYDRPLLLVSEKLIHQKIAEKYLSRLGFDSIIGYLDGGIDGWNKDGRDVGNIEIISVHELKKRIDNGDELSIIDVRKEREWISGHIKGARNIFVGYLLIQDNIPISKPIALICNVGNRASLAASLLKIRGMKNISIVSGSMDEWQKEGYPIVRGD